MRLIRCHINGFGKLQDKDINFDDFTTVLEDNGQGKTTTAHYIVSMFYGLVKSGSKDIEKNLFKKYQPWNAESYGGSLCFEYQKKQYVVERNFNAVNNDFRLTNAKTKKEETEINGKAVLWNNLGEVLFGINRDSFERCSYVPQNSILMDKNKLDGGLVDKLRDAISNTESFNRYSKVIDILDDAIATIDSKRNDTKIGNVTAELAAIKEQIQDIKNDKTAIKQLDSDIKKYQQELNSVQEQEKNIDGQIKQYNSQKASIVIKEQFVALSDNYDNIVTELSDIVGSFPNGDVESLDLNKIKKLAKAIEDKNSIKLNAENDIEIERRLVKERNQSIDNEFALVDNGINSKLSEKDSKQKTLDSKKSDEQRLRAKSKKGVGFGSVLLIILTIGLFGIAVAGRKKRIAADIERNLSEQKTLTTDIDNATNELERLNTQKQSIMDRKNGIVASPLIDELTVELDKTLAVLVELQTEFDNATATTKDNDSSNDKVIYDIENRIASYKKLTKDEKDSKDKLTKFIAANSNFDFEQEITLLDIDSLEQDKLNIVESKAGVVQEIATLRAQRAQKADNADRLDDVTAEKEQLDDRLAQYKYNLDALKSAKELVIKANDALAERYLDPLIIKSNEFLTKAGMQIELDADSKIFVQEAGRARDLNHFSTGKREFISIIMRMALVDIIYTAKNERPFVMLDDPFVNLDKVNIEEITKKIKDVTTGKQQVIYFTCHESRKF